MDRMILVPLHFAFVQQHRQDLAMTRSRPFYCISIFAAFWNLDCNGHTAGSTWWKCPPETTDEVRFDDLEECERLGLPAGPRAHRKDREVPQHWFTNFEKMP